jgi:hypothetical protein
MYQVKAYWDAESRMWRGGSADFPELAVQAATMEALIADVRDRMLDLVVPGEDRCAGPRPISISFIASRSEIIARPY